MADVIACLSSDSARWITAARVLVDVGLRFERAKSPRFAHAAKVSFQRCLSPLFASTRRREVRLATLVDSSMPSFLSELLLSEFEGAAYSLRATESLLAGDQIAEALTAL